MGRAPWLILLAALALPAAAGAQSQSEVSAARELFRQGLEAARAERWEEARGHFERSYAIAPRLPTLLNLAGAQVQTGQLVAGAESYRRFISEAQSGREARYVPQAREALRAVEPRIAHLRIDVEPGEGEAVALDGEDLASAALDIEIPVDPGTHTLVLHRGDAERDREEVTLAEGQRREVRLEATVDLRVASTEPSTPAPAIATTAAPSDDSGLFIGLGVGIGVAVAVAIALGIYFGLEAANAPHTGNLGPGMIQFE